MDPLEYRDARWYALLREAAELGVPEEEARVLVEQVLRRSERRIRRSDDPDPLVRAALAAAVLGAPPSARGRHWPAALALTGAVAVAVAVVLLARPTPPPTHHLRGDQVPSWFGYDGPAAERMLEARGLRVRLQPFQACEVMGRVVASDPPPGTAYRRGDRVTVYTALPADITCLTDSQDRALAWELVDFATGRGPAPPFAPRVWVYPSDGERAVLTDREAADPHAWASTGVLADVRRAADEVSLRSEHPVSYLLPAIKVVPATEGLGRCGVPDPSVAGTADAVAVLVRPAGGSGCPLRVELYRDDRGRIESVALYRGSS